ncbi:alpha-L-arabinofuranosidase C-terminal domain-containing protein [Nonomuraea gerenzanensis]|uniref:non-reducing end alpha-L-arabinofuranosidase n=1 Tax=Nonomuraea gerenzanensis TaxID=93944 RepID=A0A1M4EL11_9ACTN|nr:alpha-L-arabinofuranosidase C-terminal domain-containing protein [Nonomuraea gerenzanensis]UBU11091.1 carbohydrate binding domain-containing protein [Nonomuraea gerenzanensis]SBO99552.1 Alpha-N-arabinofuranosidase [Nonomuraea gerenzanensis]
MLRIALSALLLAGLLSAPPAIAAADPLPDGAVVDQFDGTTLGEDWTVLSPDDSRWSLSGGALHLDTLTGDTHQGTNNARNLFLVDVPDGDFEVVTELSAPVSLDYQSAGLLAWQDWDNYVRAGLAHVGFAGGPVIETATEVGAAFTSAFAARPGSTAETLKLARTGDEFTSSYWDGTAWVQASKLTAKLKIGQVGLFGLSAQNGTSMRAGFDYLAIKAAEGAAVVPDGPFTLRAGAAPYLTADRSGVVRVSAKAPMTGLVLKAEAGALKDVESGRYLQATTPVRLGTQAVPFQLKDAGGGKVTLSSGGQGVAVTDGRLVLGAGATKFRVEGYTTGELSVDTRARGTEVSPNLYGVFYEDINHAADGGLYAELVQNRSFEFNSVDEPSYTGLTAWSEAERGATVTPVVTGEQPLNTNNRNYLRLDVTGAGTAGVVNAGFNRGLPLAAGERYDFSVWARRAEAGPLTVTVEDGTTVLGKVTIRVRAGGWAKYRASFTASATTDAGRLVVQAPAGRTDLDMVSLFPRDTFKGHGMRTDLAELIAGLKPRFLRFPGGCVTNVGTYEPYAETGDRRRIYQWKETIGPVEERPTNFNFWGYNQSYGIGYYEYFQFAEDLGAEALPVLSVGVNGCGENRPLTDETKLARWVQDTLDLIEFANGPVTSPWGRKRAELGHPKPFGLEYIGLGNEEIYPEFFTNYPKFADAIRAEYPDIKIISNSGQTSQGAWFDRMWQFARDQRADLVDEHYYNNPDWFLASNHRYDTYDREGPKVFVGEYASRGNTFFNALAEASYMTGLERNSDVVELASYAPLLANVDYVDWTPDLIWFDNDQAYGSPSYHVQRLFSTNVGERVVPSTFEGQEQPVEDIKGAIGLGAWNTAVRYDDVKVTAADGTVLLADDFSAGAGAWTPGPGTWAVQDGAYAQTAQVEDARSTAGSADWSNYTIEVTARKTAGAEGFLVMFGVRDTGNFYWWNVGGWNNTQSAIEKAVDGGKSSIATSATTVETGRDHRLKVQVSGRRITTWLDGQQINDFVDSSRVEPLYQVVSRDGKSVTLKVVNAQDTAVRSTVDLGAARFRPTATVTSLTGAPSDTNSIADPDRVAPVRRQVSGFSHAFTYDFPAYSVTFIELTER